MGLEVLPLRRQTIPFLWGGAGALSGKPCQLEAWAGSCWLCWDVPWCS